MGQSNTKHFEAICNDIAYTLQGLQGNPLLGPSIAAVLFFHRRFVALQNCDQSCVELGKRVHKAATLLKYIAGQNIPLDDDGTQLRSDNFLKLETAIGEATEKLESYRVEPSWRLACFSANTHSSYFEKSIKDIDAAIDTLKVVNMLISIDLLNKMQQAHNLNHIDLKQHCEQVLRKLYADLRPGGNRVHPENLDGVGEVDVPVWIPLSVGRFAQRRADGKCCARNNTGKNKGKSCDNPGKYKYKFKLGGVDETFWFCGKHAKPPKEPRWGTGGEYFGEV